MARRRPLYRKRELLAQRRLRPQADSRYPGTTAESALQAAYYGGECPGVYFVKLQRDNWTLAAHTAVSRLQELHIFEKELGRGWILRKIAHGEIGAPPGHGCYWDEHEIENAEKGITQKFPDWEWADLDRGRLVWAASGKLWAGYVRRQGGLQDMKCLRDFNEMKFEAMAAPY